MECSIGKGREARIIWIWCILGWRRRGQKPRQGTLRFSPLSRLLPQGAAYAFHQKIKTKTNGTALRPGAQEVFGTPVRGRSHFLLHEEVKTKNASSLYRVRWF